MLHLLLDLTRRCALGQRRVVRVHVVLIGCSTGRKHGLHQFFLLTAVLFHQLRDLHDYVTAHLPLVTQLLVDLGDLGLDLANPVPFHLRVPLFLLLVRVVMLVLFRVGLVGLVGGVFGIVMLLLYRCCART